MLDRGLRRRFPPGVERAAREAARRETPRRARARAATCASLPTFTIDPSPRGTSTTRSPPSALGDGAHCASGSTSPTSSAYVPPGLAGRPRGVPPRHERLRPRRGRADAARGALERRLLARARAGPAGGDGRARAATGADGAAGGVPPLADPLRRAARLRPQWTGIFAGARARRRRRGPSRSPRRARPPRRSRPSATPQARWRSSRSSRSSRSTARGPRHGAAATRADGVAPPDRAPHDRRQRGGRDAARADRGVPALYRVHERPEPAGRRAPGRRSWRRSACRRRRCPSTYRRRAGRRAGRREARAWSTRTCAAPATAARR